MTVLPPNADENSEINEIISAYLDGEARPDEQARVESDPALMARVEQLRAQSLNVTVSAPPALKELHLSAALDLFEEQHDRTAAPEDASNAASPDPAPVAPVASLDTARQRKRPRRLNVVTGIAAALALVFAGIVAFGFNSGTGDEVVAADVAIESMAQDASEAPAAFDSDAPAADNAAAASNPVEAEATSLSDATDDAADAAMDDDEAMSDEEAMSDDEAMSDEEVMEEESASDEAASAGVASNAAGSSSSILLRQPDAEARFVDDDFDALSAFTAEPLFIGAFDDIETAQQGFSASIHGSSQSDSTESDSTASDSAASDSAETAQREAFGPLDCSNELREVTNLESSTLLATATIDGMAIEFHRTSSAAVLVVDHQSCIELRSFDRP